MTTIDRTGLTTTTQHDTAHLWRGAALTAVAAVLFPRLNAVLHHDQKIWEFDSEAAVLAPLVVVVTLLIFALLGRTSWRGSRTAVTSAVLGIASVLGLVAFWLSAGIIFGGLAVTLGVESLRRTGQRRALAWTGILLGSLAVAANATVWLLGL